MQARGQRWQDVRLAAPRGRSLDWVVVLSGLKRLVGAAGCTLGPEAIAHEESGAHKPSLSPLFTSRRASGFGIGLYHGRHGGNFARSPQRCSSNAFTTSSVRASVKTTFGSTGNRQSHLLHAQPVNSLEQTKARVIAIGLSKMPTPHAREQPALWRILITAEHPELAEPERMLCVVCQISVSCH